MAKFRAYAKVLEPSDPSMRIYEAGLRPCPGPPGLVFADVLRRTGGVYETTAPLTPQLREEIREVAELTSDLELLAIADLAGVPVSLEHLRGLDPQTRIVIRSELHYEADESFRVSASLRSRPALATVMPDGTVIAGDAFPAPRLPPHRLYLASHTRTPPSRRLTRPAPPRPRLPGPGQWIAVYTGV